MVVALGTVEPHARPPSSSCWRLLFLTPELATPTRCGIQQAELLHAPSLKSPPRCVCDRRAEPEAESVQSGLGRVVGSFWLVFWVDGTRLSDGLRGNQRKSHPAPPRTSCQHSWGSSRALSTLATGLGTVARVLWRRNHNGFQSRGLGYLGSPASRLRRKDPTGGQSVLNTCSCNAACE